MRVNVNVDVFRFSCGLNKKKLNQWRRRRENHSPVCFTGTTAGFRRRNNGETSSAAMLGNYDNPINFDPPIIFPPINHENLLSPEQISQVHKNNSADLECAYSNSDSDSDSDSISSSTFSSSDSSPSARSPLASTPKAKPAAIGFDYWIQILRTKVRGIMRFIWCDVPSSRAIWAFPSLAVVAVFIAFLYFRQWRRLRSVEASNGRLLGVVREKDEKINQLLNQISRLNQVLLATAAVRLGAGTPSGN